MKKLTLIALMAFLAFQFEGFAQPLNMSIYPINFGNGCAYGQIQDLNGTRKLSLGGYNGCIGPPGGWTSVTVDYWSNRVGIGLNFTSPSYQLQLSQNSAAKPGSAYWTVVSDARFKKDIKPYQRGLDLITAIQPVYFRYNEKSGVQDHSEFVGVLAQDLQKVAPDMVKAIPDPNEKDKTTDYLSVDLSQIDFALINAVKELNNELEALRSEVANLKEQLQLATLKTDIDEATLEVAKTGIQIAPNPFEASTVVHYNLGEQNRNASIEIYSIDGKLIQTKKLPSTTEGNITLSLDNAPIGTLIFRLIANGEIIDSKQVIHNR